MLCVICGAENKLIHVICLILVSTELLPATYGSPPLLPFTPSDCGINKASEKLLFQLTIYSTVGPLIDHHIELW